jgi:hypothetical protein
MEIETKIWKDNRSFLKDRAVFNEQLLAFAWKIVSKQMDGSKIQHFEGTDFAPNTFKFSLDFCVNVVYHWSEPIAVKNWTEVITSKISEMDISFSLYILPLLKEMETMRSLLLYCYVDGVRDAFVSIIYAILKLLSKAPKRKSENSLLLFPCFAVEQELIVCFSYSLPHRMY